MQAKPEWFGTLVALTLSLAVAGCNDGTGPAMGSIQVTTTTTGDNVDPDGYTVTLDGRQPRAIVVNGSVTFSNVAAGEHTVEVSDVAANCTFGGDNPRSVAVARGATVPVAFAVTCRAPGNVEVTTSTSGQTIDPDGYSVSIDEGAGEPTGVNATLTLQDILPGPRSVKLEGISANCTVNGDNPRIVDVPAAGTARTTFSVTCAFALRNQIVFASDRDGNYEVYVMNDDGTGLRNLTNNPAEDFNPAISPDGTKIAFETSRDANHEIYVMNADGTGAANVTNNSAWDEYPAWSPDGRRIAFDSDRDGGLEIYTVNADGRNPNRLTDAPGDNFDPTWSPDGTKIAFVTSRELCCEIYVMNADGTDQINLTKTAAVRDLDPAWSPDGRKIAFDTRRDGNFEVYVMNADGTGVVNLTKHGAVDRYPAWSPDGRKIVFHSNRDGDFEIYVMSASGTGFVNLTRNPATDQGPAWSR